MRTRQLGIFMLVVAIAIMSQRQAGIVQFVAAAFSVDNAAMALIIGVPFAVCGVLIYVPRLRERWLPLLLLPMPAYALLAAYIAVTGTGNFVPALFYALNYILITAWTARGNANGH